MAKQIADVQIHAPEIHNLYDDLDISVDQIDDGLYLGNFKRIYLFYNFVYSQIFPTVYKENDLKVLRFRLERKMVFEF